MPVIRSLLLTLLVLCAALPVAARQRPLTTPPTVSGYVWTEYRSPVTDITVRLREVTQGGVVTAVTDARGWFGFTQPVDGIYVVEVVRDDRVVTVGSPFVFKRGDATTMFLTVPAMVPVISSNVGTSVLPAVLESAYAVGVFGVVTPQQPGSPPPASSVR